CDKQVFNVSAMTADEAEALLASRAEERTCVRFYRRSDGTVMTSNCAIGAKRERRRRAVLSPLGAGALAAAALAAFRERTVMGEPVAGEIAPVFAPPEEEEEPSHEERGRFVMGDSVRSPSAPNDER